MRESDKIALVVKAVASAEKKTVAKTPSGRVVPKGFGAILDQHSAGLRICRELKAYRDWRLIYTPHHSFDFVRKFVLVISGRGRVEKIDWTRTRTRLAKFDWKRTSLCLVHLGFCLFLTYLRIFWGIVCAFFCYFPEEDEL